MQRKRKHKKISAKKKQNFVYFKKVRNFAIRNFD